MKKCLGRSPCRRGEKRAAFQDGAHHLPRLSRTPTAKMFSLTLGGKGWSPFNTYTLSHTRLSVDFKWCWWERSWVRWLRGGSLVYVDLASPPAGTVEPSSSNLGSSCGCTRQVCKHKVKRKMFTWPSEKGRAFMDVSNQLFWICTSSFHVNVIRSLEMLTWWWHL